jgi:hypothetical protein
LNPNIIRNPSNDKLGQTLPGAQNFHAYNTINGSGVSGQRKENLLRGAAGNYTLNVGSSNGKEGRNTPLQQRLSKIKHSHPSSSLGRKADGYL